MAECPPEKRRRFGSPAPASEMEQICKGYIPPNTQKATDWSLHIFKEWQAKRNKGVKQVPMNLLEEPSVKELNKWLSCFVVEAACEDGKPYPPSSISNILAGLYRYAKSCGNCPNFMNRKDPQFKDLNHG